MNGDEWVVFDKRKAPVVKTPLVTLQKSGNFSMNQASFKALKEPKVVELLYNLGKQQIGFRKGDPAAPHVYPVRRQQNSLNYQFSGVAFTSAFDIETGTARRFKAELNDDTLVIDLKHPLGKVSRDRTKVEGKGT